MTDLDYTPLPILTRDNTEEDFQFTQEFRFASADTARLQCPTRATRMAGGRVPLHAGLRAGGHQQLAPFVIRTVPVARALAASLRSTISGLACSARAP